MVAAKAQAQERGKGGMGGGMGGPMMNPMAMMMNPGGKQ